ncbi:MAG: PAS domain S-box protein [Campylobacterales bacterium]|nr:PAS domain S-box protein [Campylobacterales bacterium]
MKANPFLSIRRNIAGFESHKEQIISQWIGYSEPKNILEFHKVNIALFRDYYASGVFDYFMAVIKQEMTLGDCPVMSELLAYLKDREISANELFTICSHFRKSIIDFSYDAKINSKQLFDEISYVFDENFSGVLKLYTDTIFQKEQEIAKNVQLLNEYKNALDESAIVSKTDVHGRIIYANDNFCRICGYEKEELIGRSHNIVRHKETPDAFYAQMWETLNTRRMFKSTIQNRKKDGSSYYLDITIVPITDPVEGVSEFISIGYEVTTLITARQEALDAGKAKESFLSSMSHEIRTPLNAILGFVSILLDEENDPRHSHYLRIINNSGENLLGIINDILDFSKLRSGAFSVEQKLFNPHDEFAHVLELFSQSAYAKRILIRSFIDPYMPFELIADPLRIKQVFSNLISNAIKFTPEQGEIEIVVEYRKKMLKICVSDSGEGVKKSEQENIFDAFRQTKDTQGGTGLGLSISKELAEHMGGNITYHERKPKGSRFEFEVPAGEPAVELAFPFDPAPFQKLRIAIFCEERAFESQFAFIRKYWDSFKLNTFCISSLDEDEYDLLFFIDAHIQSQHREQIANLKVPSIALLNTPSKKYEKCAYVTPLVYPVYCEKMYHAFLEALQLKPQDDGKYVKRQKQRRFKGHILVAEDNVANQELIKIILKRYGLSYYIASDGLEAVQTFKVADFDLLFMDEQMPRKDGLEATRDILKYEKQKHKKHTPVIGLSANVIGGAKERAFSFGCDAFLGKPLVIREFEEILQRYLIEQNSVENDPKSEEFKQGRIDFKMLKEELMLDDEEITLLLQTFVAKMKKSFPLLGRAIEEEDYEKISLEAHSIKGSAANFRFERLERLAGAIERSARKESKDMDYKQSLEEMEEIMGDLMA